MTVEQLIKALLALKLPAAEVVLLPEPDGEPYEIVDVGVTPDRVFVFVVGQDART